MKITKCPDLGAEVSDFDARTADEAQAARLISLVHEHKILTLTGQDLSEADYVAFARKLGTPQIYFQSNYHHPDWPEIFVSSNIPHNGKKFGVKATGRYWHTDCAFQDNPLSVTTVTARVIPEGSRGTLYIDMERVYENLPEHLRQFVDTHRARHEGKWRYKVQASDIDRAIIDILADVEKIAPPATHPAVIKHPITGRRALYISEGFTTGFVGLPHEESKKWLAELLAFVERDEHVCIKEWRKGNVLIWDNRTLIHKAAYSNTQSPSLSYRIGIYDGLPFYTE